MVKRLMNDRDFYISMATRPLPKNKFSKYRGVQKSSDAKKPYRASFRYKGKAFNLGNFENELDAAKAYNKAVVEVIGTHAIVNDLQEDQ